MMTFGTGWFGWLGLLAGIALIVGIILIVVWAVQLGGRRTDDQALGALRVRFARGEIEAAQFEEMRRLLEPTDAPRSSNRPGLIGLLLIVAALAMGVIGSLLGPAGWG